LGSAFGTSVQVPLSTDTLFSALKADNSLPYELAGVNVTIGGQAIPVAYVSPTRVTFVIPADLALGNAEMIITTLDGRVARGTTTIARNSFRVMTASEDGTGAAVALNLSHDAAGGFEVTTQENFGGDKLSRVGLFTTGISGSAQNTNGANDLNVGGTVRPNFAESVVVEARRADGQVFNLPVEFAGAQGVLPGLDQVTFVLTPQLSGAGTVQLTLVINGQRSNTATINVK
jgi:uncharacterized protein (TIGR03437 family)